MNKLNEAQSLGKSTANKKKNSMFFFQTFHIIRANDKNLLRW